MIKRISTIIETKEKMASIQMGGIESTRQKMEDVISDFKNDALGKKAKEVLGVLDKLAGYVEEENFGLAKTSIEEAIKILRSAKKRIFNDAISYLEGAIAENADEMETKEGDSLEG